MPFRMLLTQNEIDRWFGEAVSMIVLPKFCFDLSKNELTLNNKYVKGSLF